MHLALALYVRDRKKWEQPTSLIIYAIISNSKRVDLLLYVVLVDNTSTSRRRSIVVEDSIPTQGEGRYCRVMRDA